MSVLSSMVAVKKPVSELRAGCTPLASNGHCECYVKNIAQHIRNLESPVSNVLYIKLMESTSKLRLIEASDVVFECGPYCGCGATCLNRTSQRGLKYRLEVYRTPSKGWAVRSWDFIPSGAPVCEYTGVLRKSDELDNISENDYIFEIDCWQTINGMWGQERRLRDVSLPSNHSDKRDDRTESFPEFCIDAGSLGNVARFINHSCEPNLFVQCVLSSHHDIRLARVVLFAADNIPPLQEHTYDYGYEIDSVIGPEGKLKGLPCYCGAVGCRKRLY